MTKLILFTDAEVAEPVDFEAVSRNARAGDEAITGGAVGYPSHWARFTVATPTGTTIRVSKGELFQGEKIFTLDADADINLQTRLPVVANDRVYVAILARGKEEVIDQSRQVEVDADTEDTIADSLPKIDQRVVDFVLQAGLPSPTPLRPVIAGTDCCVCFVLLSATGIVAIESAQDWRVKTLYEIEGRLTQLEGRVDVTIERTATLETNLANLANQMRDVPRPEIMRQLQRDVAATRRQLKLPDNARGYWYDAGLILDDWANEHPLYFARVREGVRFPYQQIVDNRLELATPADPKLKIVQSFALPAYTEVARISVEGNDGFKDISEQVHTVRTAVAHTVSAVSVNYGPSFQVCENRAEWGNAGSVRAGQTFSVNGNQYISDGLAEGVLPNDSGGTGDFTAWNADPATTGHKGYTVRQVQYESWTQTYWSYHVQEYGVNGSIYGQTFLNAQPMIATSIDLRFTRVGSSGIVHLYLCEVSEIGAPQFDNVIAHAEMNPADLVVGWNKFQIAPTLLSEGKRYAWYTVTVGNHALATVKNNKYAQGSLFWATDGAWAQGDNLFDFAFRANAAQFADTRTVVEFVALSCPAGMSEIQLLYNGWSPAGTSLVWEVKPHGQDGWFPILNGDPSPLMGLPTQAGLRATFIGTTDLAPMIKLDQTARGAAMRIATEMRALSEELPLGFSSSTITVQSVVDYYDEAANDFDNTIMIDDVIIEADTTSVEVDYDKPTRRTFTSLFTLGDPTTSVRVRPVAASTDPTKTPFVQNIAMYAQ